MEKALKTHMMKKVMMRDQAIKHTNLDVVRDPFDKVGAVFVLDVQHVLVHLLHAHAAAENRRHREVPAVPRIAGGHHVFRVEKLRGQLADRQIAVNLTAAWGERREARHEKVQPRKRHHVHGQLTQIRVQLA